MLSERTLALSISSMELEGRLGLRELCSFAREIRELKLSELRPSLSFSKLWSLYCLFTLSSIQEVKKENYEHNYVIEFFYYLHKNKNNEKLI